MRRIASLALLLVVGFPYTSPGATPKEIQRLEKMQK